MEKANRWTTYIQDYIGSFPDSSNNEAIPEQFLEALAAKPVFLNRYGFGSIDCISRVTTRRFFTCRNVRRVKKAFGSAPGKPAVRQAQSVSIEGASSEETGDAEQPSTSGTNVAADANESGLSRSLKDVRLSENLQVQVNRSPSRHVNGVTKFRYVAGSEDYFLRSGCIQRARNVSLNFYVRGRYDTRTFCRID